MKLFHSFSLYITTILTFLHHLLFSFLNLTRIPSFLFTCLDFAVTSYFYLQNLSPCTVDLDDKTTVHFWTPNHRRFNRPNLLMVHGYGGDSKWQFTYQIGTLSRRFNVYVPDLLFFGKSYTVKSERSDQFQAKCVVDGMRRLGVGKFSVYSISYGGYVAYRMAESYPEVVEKMVIVSSGVGCSDDRKREQVKKIGRDVSEILVPKSSHDLRLLIDLSMSKIGYHKWLPDFLLQEFITKMYTENRKEQMELANHLMEKQDDPIQITKETLIIWGDKDKVFPIEFAYQLQRYLPKSRVEIIKNTGHAANMESPNILNHLITSFVIDCN